MSQKFKDLIGQKFGRLTVLYDTGKKYQGRIIWKCICCCGNETEVVAGSLVRGFTKSCGCYCRERLQRLAYKHGDSNNCMGCGFIVFGAA